MGHNHRGSETSAMPCPACHVDPHADCKARLDALTAEQARRLCAEGHEQHRLWSVCYVCQLQDAVDTEQARVAALTAALEEIRRTSHDGTSLEIAHQALGAAGGP